MKHLVALLREQHASLLIQVDQLTRRLETPLWWEQCAGLHATVARFGELLIEHLAIEDEAFYPRAFQHPKGSELAHQFHKDMGHLRDTVDGYLEAWPNDQEIAKNPAGFKDYTEALVRFLHRRIEAEEKELYPTVVEEP
jgi:hemerythrin-like domain-containing protein